MHLFNLQLNFSRWCSTLFQGTPYEPTKKIWAKRAVEELAELCQAAGDEDGLTLDEFILVAHYVYNRPVGEPPQEAAQALLNLTGYADALGIDLDNQVEHEYARIDTPEMRQKIYDKQEFKKRNGLG